MLRLLEVAACILEAGMKAVGAKPATAEALRTERRSFMVSNVRDGQTVITYLAREYSGNCLR